MRVVDWTQTGPDSPRERVLAYLREEVPKRRAMTAGLWDDCVAALGLAVRGDAARVAIGRCARADLLQIKATVGIATGAPSARPTAPAGTPSSPAPWLSREPLVDRLSRRRTDEKRAAAIAACPVCKLPAELREQIRVARRAGYTVAEIVALLAEDGIRITPANLSAHSTGGHER